MLITIIHPMITINRDGVSVKVYSSIHGVLIIIIDAISAVIIISFSAALLLQGAVNMVRLNIAVSIGSWELLQQRVIPLWTDLQLFIHKVTIVLATFIITGANLVVQKLICGRGRNFSASKIKQFNAARAAHQIPLILK